MFKFKLALSVLIFTHLYISYSVAGENTDAGEALKNSAQASGNASAGAAHTIAASGQVTSAAMVIPLSVGGAVLGSTGAVSAGSAHESRKGAISPIGMPLEITDEAIVTTPPNEALKKTNDVKNSDKKL